MDEFKYWANSNTVKVVVTREVHILATCVKYRRRRLNLQHPR